MTSLFIRYGQVSERRFTSFVTTPLYPGVQIKPLKSYNKNEKHNMKTHTTFLLLPLLSAGFGLSAVAQVGIPFSNDFNSSVADFTETTGSGASWSLDTANSEYDNTATGSGSAIASSSVINTPDLSGTNFTLATTFTLNSASIAGGSDATFGFAAYADSADLSGSYSSPMSMTTVTCGF